MSAGLDEFFARAEDVLTDWDGSVDSARWRNGETVVPAGGPRRTGSVTLVLTADATGFIAGMARAMESMGRAAAAATAALREFAERLNRKPLQPSIVKHSFRPDFDLRCLSSGCNLLPEEH